MKLSSGSKVGHFKILSQIGKGGMGEVYLAEDLKLDRRVAIKFLNEKYSQDQEKLRRFIQEAKATSALNHPHILTIHEIDEFEGNHYIATEYIEGETLRDHLNKKDTLSLNRILKIGIQTAEALFAAHEAGIIHRDIKPENIMIRKDGYVKVLDFGLAKLTGENKKKSEISLEGDTKVQVKTDPGSVMGTASYMSPEQASGKEVDARTDIWSLGVVLYEMLAGRVPFQGKTVSHTLVGIMEKEPRRIEDIPNALQRIVRKALTKDREMRYQLAKDLFIDLKNLKRELDLEGELERSVMPEGEATETEGEKETEVYSVDPAQETETAQGGDTRTVSSESSLEYAVKKAKSHKIATLSILGVIIAGLTALGYFYLYSPNSASPLTDKDVILITDFENKTGEEIFDGTLKQGLTMALQQSPFLSIFPDRQAHETLKMMKRPDEQQITRKMAGEICQRNGLKAYITGNLSKLGNLYVVGLEAVNGNTEERIALTQAEAESREQVLKALSKAASEMRAKLGESLTQIEKLNKPLPEATTESLEALKALQGGKELRNNSKIDEAIVLFKKAVEIDPEFAGAYLALARIYYGDFRLEMAMDALVKAFSLRDKVSEIERISIEAFYYTNFLGDTHQAIDVLEAGKKLYPRRADFRISLAFAYYDIGEFEKALPEAEEAVKLDAKDPRSHETLYYSLIGLGRFNEAKRILQERLRQGLKTFNISISLYTIALLENDSETMETQLNFLKKSGRLSWLEFAVRGDTAGFRGQATRGVKFYRQAIDQLGRLDKREGQMLEFDKMMIRQALLGRCAEVRSLVKESPEALFHFRRIMFKPVALVWCGYNDIAQPIIDEAKKKYPSATGIHKVWLPVIGALREVEKGNPEQAIALLEQVKGYERAGGPEGYFFIPQYLRGQSFLLLGRNDQAKAEFENILKNPGEWPYSPLYPLAQLGKARALKDKDEYKKFFEMWKDADENLPALIEAKKEYQDLN
jgi:serine/threonine protein kinase/Flp pilus assembly protein TadD